MVAGVSVDLLSVWGSSPSDLWAVGQAGAIWHRGGATWGPAESGVAVDLHAVWGTGASDVWVVGGLGTVLRHDGRAWSRVESGTDQDLSAIWGSGPSDLWIAGGPLLHYDGTVLEPPPGDPIEASALWGRGPEEVWATSESRVLHWDGAAWSEATAVPGCRLGAITGAGPSLVLALGEDPDRSPDTSCGARFDGSSWVTSSSGDLALPRTSAPLRAAWGTGPTDLWIADGGGTIHHLAGDSWEPSRIASVPLNGLWGSGPDDLWVVGARGAVLRRTAGDRGLPP